MNTVFLRYHLCVDGRRKYLLIDRFSGQFSEFCSTSQLMIKLGCEGGGFFVDCGCINSLKWPLFKTNAK